MKCSEVAVFFNQVSAKSISAKVDPADLSYMKGAGLINLYTNDEFKELADEVARLQNLNNIASGTANDIGRLRAEYSQDYRETHSILFHLKGHNAKEEEEEKFQQESAALKEDESKLTEEQAQIADLIKKKSILDGLTKYDNYYISLTNSGRTASHNLGIRMYRVSDLNFNDFIAQDSATTSELISIANKTAVHFKNLSSSISVEDPSHIWSIAVGLSKIQGDPAQLDEKFVRSYAILEKLTKNQDNLMMSSEIFTSSNEEPDKAFEALSELNHQVRHHAKVDKESSLGVSTILYFARSYDGTYPLDKFIQYRGLTESDESAAIMASINSPFDEISGKYRAMRTLFGKWGYGESEDTELSSSYLAISDLPSDGVQTKLGIIINGLKSYLEYPLVASSILASIPVFEANETLDLVEQAYTIFGKLGSGLSQSELIGLAVRAIHGIRNEIVRNLDTTAKIASTPVQFSYLPSGMWMPLFVPFIVPMIAIHSSYYSTFSSMGGVHPGHMHVSGGMQG